MILTRNHPFLRYWLPVLLYCLFIFVLSSQPRPRLFPGLFLKDKVLHVLEFSVLGFLFLRGLRNSRFRNKRGLIIATSVLLTVLYGIGDEIHQPYVPYRTGDIGDALSDCIGAILGVYVYHRLLENNPKLESI